MVLDFFVCLFVELFDVFGIFFFSWLCFFCLVGFFVCCFSSLDFSFPGQWS